MRISMWILPRILGGGAKAEAMGSPSKERVND